ncbi:MAG: carboxypeptidase-like regulatory domain-containing protein, partial [Planctomycetota bacterium]
MRWRFRAERVELDDLTAGGEEPADFFVDGDSGTLSALGYGGVAAPERDYEEGTLRTDEHGTFRIAPEWSSGEIKLEIEVDAVYRAVEWESDDLDADIALAPLELVRVPRGLLAGRVVDLDERPMKGVTVRGEERYGDELVEAVTNDEGRFQLALRATNIEIEAELAGHVAASLGRPVALTAGGWEPHEIVMTRAGSLVIDLGRAPAGAESMVRGAAVLPSLDQHHVRSDYFLNLQSFQGLADQDGLVRVDGLPVGQKLVVYAEPLDQLYTCRRGASLVAVDADGSGVAPDGAVPIVIPESGLLEVSIDDRETRRVHGRVVDASGRGVPGVFVEAMAEYRSNWLTQSLLAQTKTDDEGRFEMLVVERGRPGPFVLRASGMSGAR